MQTKARGNSLFTFRRLRTLLAVGFAASALNLQAQVTLTTLHSFSQLTNGGFPKGNLCQGTDGYVYGTTSEGGTNGDYGTIFKISTNGSLTTLYFFTGSNDGANPGAGLVQGNDGCFYGTTTFGGTNGDGTVFKISSSGAFASLYSFSGGADGSEPEAGLIQGCDGYFYGTTYGGGTNGLGTVFRISSTGILTSLYSFVGANGGTLPQAGLFQGNDGNFYGTTSSGGTNGDGTIFQISPSGSFTCLYSFTGSTDGSMPNSSLIQGNDGYLYGTTPKGGTNTYGTVFKISTNGALTSLHSFTGSGSDGNAPEAGLVQGTDGFLYGTTSLGGTNNYGAIFKISTNGSISILYSFTEGTDGSSPESALIQGSDGYFYGTSYYGGSISQSAVFKISVSGSFTTLYGFNRVFDGGSPEGNLIQGNDGYFYGTTSSGNGSVFKINSSGVFSNLYFFSGADGMGPQAGLVQGTDGYFYGTTSYGGAYPYNGNIFKMSSAGILTNLYSFPGGHSGSDPDGALIQGTDGYFYGTTYNGGTNNYGGVFKISPAGSFANFYSFTSSAEYPEGGVIQSADGYFYGTTYGGGAQPGASGTVFKLSASGAFTRLYTFKHTSDGEFPQAGLIQGSDGFYYGTTGGAPLSTLGQTPAWQGSVFKISSNGVFTVLHTFTGGSDGGRPEASLVQGSDGYFYGTTWGAFSPDYGTIFRVSSTGSFTTLHTFTSGADGAHPLAGLIQGPDGNFYGTTTSSAGTFGTVYCLNMGLHSSGAPRLQFQASAANNYAPMTVHFTSPATDTGGNNIISWNWTFGDGSSSTLQNPSHTYTNTGPYSPTLFVTNNNMAAILATGPQIIVSPTPILWIPSNGSISFSNGAFGFNLSGPAGSNVVIETSINLTNWTPLQSNVFGSNGSLYIQDLQSPTNTLRFYRAVVP